MGLSWFCNRQPACCLVVHDGGLSWPFAVLPGWGILQGSLYLQRVWSSGHFGGSSGCARWSVRTWLRWMMNHQCSWGCGHFCCKKQSHWQWMPWYCLSLMGRRGSQLYLRWFVHIHWHVVQWNRLGSVYWNGGFNQNCMNEMMMRRVGAQQRQCCLRDCAGWP